MDTSAESLSVSVVLLKRPSPSPWADASWRLLGVLPGLSETQLAAFAQQGELHIIAEQTIQLYKQHCDAYYVNLTSQQAKIYFAFDSSLQQIKPILLTVDFDEAAALMETGEQVLEAPLAEHYCLWLEKFVLAHYQPEAPKKRKRQNWSKADNDR